MQSIIFSFNEGLKESLGEQSLLRYLASLIPNFPFSIMFYGFVASSMLIFFYKLLCLKKSVYEVKGLLQRSTLLGMPRIQNAKLKEWLQKSDIKIYESIEIISPMAAFNNIIIFPQRFIKEITQEEFEAIIAHEIEHLKWKDSGLKCLLEMTSALFWWIPTRWWINRLLLEQEMACDFAIQKYKMAKHIMASSIIKSIKLQHKFAFNHAAICQLSGAPYCFRHRINALLNNSLLPKAMMDITLICFIILVSVTCLFN